MRERKQWLKSEQAGTNGREFLFYAEYNGTCCKFLKRGEAQSEFLIQAGWRQGGQEESPAESRLETGHPPRPVIQAAPPEELQSARLKWSESECCSVVPNSLWPHELQSPRLLCPWDFLGKDTGAICHFLLHEIFPTQDRTQFSCIAGRFFIDWHTSETLWNGMSPAISTNKDITAIWDSSPPNVNFWTWRALKRENNAYSRCHSLRTCGVDVKKEGCWPLIPEVPVKGMSSVSPVQFSCSAVSDSLRPHGLQHARPPCPSPTPGVYSNSCPLSQWCHPTISSSVVPFSSRLQSFRTSGSFQMSQFFIHIRWPKYSSFRNFSEPRGLHLPRHRKVLNSLTWDIWFSLINNNLCCSDYLSPLLQTPL